MKFSYKSIEMRVLIWSVICFVVLLFLVIFTITLGYLKIDSVHQLGSLGDALGGTTAPILASLAIVVTFLAFWIQYEANQEIRKDIRFDRFENKFYELLRLHQNNVETMEIANRFHGRKVFVKMYDEVRFIYAFIEKERKRWNSTPNQQIGNDKYKITNLAYTIFFFGIQETRRNAFYKDSGLNASFSKKVLKELLDSKMNAKSIDEKGVMRFNFEKAGSVKWNPTYPPFQGYVSKLGHYYRHLYQLFKFICTNPLLSGNHELKYSYIKIVRAQLSNHEQAMLYFNSFFNPGKIWWEETDSSFLNDQGERLSYFLDFGIIKNLPFNLVRFGPDPEVEFTQMLQKRGYSEEKISLKLHKLFEWIGG